MRVVICTKSSPFPPTNGSAIRNYQLIRMLARRHQLTLITFVRTDEERAGLDELRAHCTVVPIDERRTVWRKVRDVVRSVATGMPYTVCAHSSHMFREAIAAAAADADMVQVQELYLVGSLPAVRCPAVLDAHNVEASILERLAAVEQHPLRRRIYHAQAAAMDRYEREGIKRFKGIIALSAPELRHFEQIHPLVTLAPNGVSQRDALPGHPRAAASLLFVGTLEYPPNRDAVEHFITAIFPLIEARIPDAELRIIGTTPAWTERFRGRRGVHFLGRVKELQGELAHATAMIVPLRAGGGTRLKILDAFTAGVPVISTTIGAEGLDVTDGIQLLLRDSPTDFAEAVCNVLGAPEHARELAHSAFAWSQSTLLWERIVDNLEPFYAEVRAE